MARRHVGFIALLTFMFSLMAPVVLYAQEIPVLYRGMRTIGMGGAFTALSDDENALFYNPAGLNDVSLYGGTDIFNPLFEISSDSVGLASDLADLEGSNLVNVTNFLRERVGEHQHVRFSLFPNILVHNIGVGILAQGTGDLEIRNQSIPDAVTDIKTDIGLVGGVAYGLLDGIQIGVGAKLIQRRGVRKTFTVVDIAGGQFDPLDSMKSEFGYSFDIGVLSHIDRLPLGLPIPLDPTVGLVLQNVTDLDFDTLGKIPQQLNLGFAIHPTIYVMSSTLAFDILDLTKETGQDDDMNKRMHLGAELRFPVVASLRVGLNQMKYVTAGVTLDVLFMQFDFATYGEEIGVYAGQREDRRYLFQLTFGI